MAEQFQFTVEHVIAIRKALRAFHDELGPFIGQYVQGPAPGSQAAQEMATTDERREQLGTAISQGGFLIESAADHLMLFAKALDEPVQPMAPLTCARAVIEACGYAAWFLDPAIDADERIARGLGRRHQGLDEKRKFLDSEKRRSGDSAALNEILVHTLDRLRHVDQLSTSLAIPRANVPNSSDTAKTQLNKEPDYRMLSAIVHGHQWALYEAGFIAATVSPAGDPLAKKEVKPTFICTSGLRAQEAITQASWCLARLYGMDLAKFAKIADSFFDRAGIYLRAVPFWRKALKA